MSNAQLDILEEIAHRELGTETLQTRNSDSLDFQDCSVWGLKKALEAAYSAGEASARLALATQTK